MSRLRLLPLSLLAVLALLFTACGDDDDTSTAAEDTTEETDDSTTETSEPEDDASDDGDTDSIGAAGLGECGFLAEFADSFDDLDPTALFATGEEVDFGSFFGPLAQQFQQVADAAPSDIQDAFRTVADGFTEVADQLEGVVIDLSDPENVDPEAMAKLESLDSTFTGDFETASAEIDAWVTENCGDLASEFDLDGFGG